MPLRPIWITVIVALAACSEPPSPKPTPAPDASRASASPPAPATGEVAPAPGADPVEPPRAPAPFPAPSSSSRELGLRPRKPRAGEAARDAVPKLDLSCESAADCAIKNVGNCCGYYPRCVNVDSEPDPEAVRAECEREGKMGICGFPEIESCGCRAGKCVSLNGSAE